MLADSIYGGGGGGGGGGNIRGSFFMFIESGCISTNIEFKVP